jgi:predicted nucleotide-binding protein
MANRNKKTIKPEVTVLIKSKQIFQGELSERIKEGQKIIADRIENDTDFINAKRHFSEWTDYNMELLKQSFNIQLNEYQQSYKGAGGLIGFRTISKSSIRKPGQDLSDFISKVQAKIDNLKKLHNKVDLLKSYLDESEMEVSAINKLNKSQVFIVHGHDEEAKSKTARFVEKLGFDAIILHEKASSSKTIIEKIEEYSNVGFGIVLYTPCDLGGKKTEKPELKSRARQNVVFEHGFLIGKIGRGNVCALVKGDVEIPNDISGVIYVQMDSSDTWRYTVAREMKESGYKIDMNKI